MKRWVAMALGAVAVVVGVRVGLWEAHLWVESTGGPLPLDGAVRSPATIDSSPVRTLGVCTAWRVCGGRGGADGPSRRSLARGDLFKLTHRPWEAIRHYSERDPGRPGQGPVLDPELAATGGSRQWCRNLPPSPSQEPEMRWPQVRTMTRLPGYECM